MRILSRLSLAILILGLVPEALAAIPPPVTCNGLAGCGLPPANVLFTSTLPVLIRILANIAAGASVICIVIAGWQLLISWGDESKITHGRWGIIYALLGLGLTIVSQTIVAFVISENYGQGSSEFLFGGALPAAVRIMVTLFNVALVLVIMFAGFQMAIEGGKAESYMKGLNIIKWAIGGAVVVNLAHALVNAFLLIGL